MSSCHYVMMSIVQAIFSLILFSPTFSILSFGSGPFLPYWTLASLLDGDQVVPW